MPPADRPAPKRRPAKKAAAEPAPLRPNIPEPPRPLGPEGLKVWERVWSLRKRWIDQGADLEHVMLLAESMDERVALRLIVFRTKEWRDRVALRALDAQIADLIARLGLNPADRDKLNPREEAPGGRLAHLRQNRGT